MRLSLIPSVLAAACVASTSACSSGSLASLPAAQTVTAAAQPAAPAAPAPSASATASAASATTSSASIDFALPGTVPFASGPFVTPVRSPQIDPNSNWLISTALGGDTTHLGTLQFATATSGPTDDNVTVYLAHDSDPVYTIHCRYYTNCPIEGVREHIPVGAVPAGRLGYTSFFDDGVHDQHMAVRNVDSQTEIDTWLTTTPSGSGGTLDVGYGAQYAVSGTGTGEPGATAAGFALSQGRIRAADLIAGRIPFALSLVTPCENGHVAPAVADDGAYQSGCPPIGAHVWLDSSPADVAASGVAPDVAVVLDALHEFGGYVGDRCTSCTLGVALEGGASYVARGLADPWTQIAAMFPAESEAGSPPEYHVPIATGSIDLGRHLHVISP